MEKEKVLQKVDALCAAGLTGKVSVHKVMDRWFDEIMAYSPQDQISFPYALATGPWSAPRHRAGTAGFPEGSLRTATGEGGLVVAQFDDGISHEETSLYKKHGHPPEYWY